MKESKLDGRKRGSQNFFCVLRTQWICDTTSLEQIDMAVKETIVASKAEETFHNSPMTISCGKQYIHNAFRSFPFLQWHS